MENKKYLDKFKRYLDIIVIDLVKGTKIDYDRKKMHFPFFGFNKPINRNSSPSYSDFLNNPLRYLNTNLTSYEFSRYCKHFYGLTKEESKYVREIYVDIIKNKIENGE
jgi:hypothetical protein